MQSKPVRVEVHRILRERSLALRLHRLPVLRLRCSARFLVSGPTIVVDEVEAPNLVYTERGHGDRRGHRLHRSVILALCVRLLPAPAENEDRHYHPW